VENSHPAIIPPETFGLVQEEFARRKSKGGYTAYCKVHLGKNERKIFSAGNKIDVFKFKEYTFGIQICLDTHIMDMSIMQKEQGAEIIIAPFKTPYDSQKRAKNWSKYMLARAYECNFCMICSNYYGGIQIVNGNGICVKENLKNNSFLVYTVSQENDFNKKIDYFSYRKPELY
ncbi:MAG: omega-amidase, partial [Acetobacterium sp.]|nr:omega-amidase [Acetobacterium sp.]